MRSYFLFLFLCFASLAQGQSSDDAVRITRTIESISGEEYNVQISITQSVPYTGFAKYVDSIPEGATITILEPEGSLGRVEGKTLKFLWVTYPDKKEVVVRYRMKLGEELNPYYPGTFIYVRDNMTAKSTLNPRDVKTGNQPDPPALNPDSSWISRLIIAEGGKDYTVRVTVNTPRVLDGIVRYTETLPPEAKVKMTDSKNATARVSDGQLKLIWATFPPPGTLTLEYVLTVPFAPDKAYPGLLSFTHNNKETYLELKKENCRINMQKQVIRFPERNVISPDSR